MNERIPRCFAGNLEAFRPGGWLGFKPLVWIVSSTQVSWCVYPFVVFKSADSGFQAPADWRQSLPLLAMRFPVVPHLLTLKKNHAQRTSMVEGTLFVDKFMKERKRH